MTEPHFFAKLVFETDDDTPQNVTYKISTRYANIIKTELVRYELKSEGIDPD